MQKFKEGETVVFFDADPNVDDKRLLHCWKPLCWYKDIANLFDTECEIIEYNSIYNSYDVKFKSGCRWWIPERYLKYVQEEPKLSDYQMIDQGVWVELTEELLVKLNFIRKKPKMKEVEKYRWVIQGTDKDKDLLWITSGYYHDEEEIKREIANDTVILMSLPTTKQTFKVEDV